MPYPVYFRTVYLLYHYHSILTNAYIASNTSQCYWRCSMLVGMKLCCDRIMWVSVYSVSVFFMQYLSYILILHCLLKTQPMSIGEYGLVFITLITLPHWHVSALAGICLNEHDSYLLHCHLYTNVFSAINHGLLMPTALSLVKRVQCSISWPWKLVWHEVYVS
jgi:hypothetical protein